MSETTRCPLCNGKGCVGGIYDGDQLMPIETCEWCDGTGEYKETVK